MHIVKLYIQNNYFEDSKQLYTMQTFCSHTIFFWGWVAQVMPENVANYIQLIYVIWLEKQGCKTEPVVRHMTYTPPSILSFILLHCLLAAQSWL